MATSQTTVDFLLDQMAQAGSKRKRSEPTKGLWERVFSVGIRFENAVIDHFCLGA